MVRKIGSSHDVQKYYLVMIYKNTTSNCYLFEAVTSSLFTLSENVEDELNRELNENITQTGNNPSRFIINKSLNEKQGEVNKQLLSLNFVGVTRPL